jgi:hypothetical protein
MEINVYEYKDEYLEEIQKRIIDRKEEIKYFNLNLLRQAVINEMAAADEETETIEISDNKEEALKKAETRILEFMEKNFVAVETKGDSITGTSQNQDAAFRTAKIPQNISWDPVQTEEGTFSFSCSGCSQEHSLQRNLFSTPLPDSKTGLVNTGRFINYGRTIKGNVVSFVIAILIGLIISWVIGKTGTGIALISAVIFLILRKILIPAFMDALSIWTFECSYCHSKNYFASDGNNLYIGKA